MDRISHDKDPVLTGMPHRIRELEIPETDLPEIAELVLTDGGCGNNPIPITTTDQVMDVLKKAF